MLTNHIFDAQSFIKHFALNYKMSHLKTFEYIRERKNSILN